MVQDPGHIDGRLPWPERALKELCQYINNATSLCDRLSTPSCDRAISCIGAAPSRRALRFGGEKFDNGIIRVYKLLMEFDFDPRKIESNKAKHGIDFTDAQKLWDDPARVIIPARTSDEPRYVLIGRISEKCWSAVFTLRGEAVRIISVRRSRNEEIGLYES